MDTNIAHIDQNQNIQTVKEHLEGTAQLAAKFAAAFDCEKSGFTLGILHDIGKYSAAFQKRIRDPEHVAKVDHATAGAKELEAVIPLLGIAIAGHHSGLMDGGNKRTAFAGDHTYYGRLLSNIPEYRDPRSEPPVADRVFAEGVQNEILSKTNHDLASLSFLIRMLYSCLVDADYLDTERFMRGDTVDRGGHISIPELYVMFMQYVAPWMKINDSTPAIYVHRTEILKECIARGAEYEQGIYTLTVPTGGGKTTASMGFALKHALTRNLSRIIYVIPYTSIIDQTAVIYEDIFGQENVVEHHSGVLYETNECDDSSTKSRKAAAVENWDAPIIVTTAVQFFESLYGNKSSVCRKLHNIAGSVIIFDEAQTLPLPYLRPCVAAISYLARFYHCTAVLCTATQPALEPYFKEYYGQSPIREICSHVTEEYEFFRRTTIHNIGEHTTDEITKQVEGHRQVLCIVNTKKSAQSIYEKLTGNDNYCLTTFLCPYDRKRKLREIKDRLKNNEECRVMATSLIEAGVDVDFPVVYREENGLDSLIQAAGRCNREGRRARENSHVYSFRLMDASKLREEQGAGALREIWSKVEDIASPESIASYFKYYRSLLGEEKLDAKQIMRQLQETILPFQKVADAFHLIEAKTTMVYVPLNEEALELLDQIRRGYAGRNNYRRVGQYGVSLYENQFSLLVEKNVIEEIADRFYVLSDLSMYSQNLGMLPDLDIELGQGFFI